MRSRLQTSTSRRFRVLGPVLAALTLSGVALTACGDDDGGGPAITGESPGEVTVPTVPPSTTAPSTPEDEPPSSTVADQGNQTPTTVEGEG